MKQTIAGGSRSTLVETTSPQYNIISGGTDWEPNEDRLRQCIPTDGNISNLYVKFDKAQAVANATITFTVMINNSPTNLTVTFVQGDISKSCLNQIVSISAGDTISLKCVESATKPTSGIIAGWSIQFESNTAGESICMTLVNFATINGTVYGYLTGMTPRARTEVMVNAPMPTAGSFKKLYVAMDADPGTSPDAIRVALRVGGASKNNTVTITADNTTGNITNVTDAVVAGTLVDFIIEPLNTPSTNYLYIWVGIVFCPTIDGESVIVGGAGNATTLQAGFYNLAGCATYSNDKGWSADETWVPSLLQECTLKNLYMTLNAAPGATYYKALTIRLDGGSSPIQAIVYNTDVAAHDTVNTQDVTNGQLSTVRCDWNAGATPSKALWGVVLYRAVSVTYVETGKVIIIKAVCGESDNQYFSEEQIILAVGGESETPIFVEARGQSCEVVVQVDESYISIENIVQEILAIVVTTELFTNVDNHEETILAEVGELDLAIFADICECVVLAEIGKTGNLLYPEAIEQIILAVVGSLENYLYPEAQEQVILAVITQFETQVYPELLEQIMLAEMGEADLATFKDDIEQIILAVITHWELMIYVNSEIAEMTILASIGSIDNAIFLDDNNLQEVLAVIGQLGGQVFPEVVEQTILAVINSLENLLYPESLEETIIAILVEANQAIFLNDNNPVDIIVEQGKTDNLILPAEIQEQTVLVVVGSSDAQIFRDNTGQIIVVIGTEVDHAIFLCERYGGGWSIRQTVLILVKTGPQYPAPQDQMICNEREHEAPIVVVSSGDALYLSIETPEQVILVTGNSVDNCIFLETSGFCMALLLAAMDHMINDVYVEIGRLETILVEQSEADLCKFYDNNNLIPIIVEQGEFEGLMFPEVVEQVILVVSNITTQQYIMSETGKAIVIIVINGVWHYFTTINFRNSLSGGVRYYPVYGQIRKIR